MLDQKLRELDDEEAELLRRLASGELTSDEEAQLRARLAAIAQERSGLEGERNQALADRHAAQRQSDEKQFAAFSGERGERELELERQLSALDDEEAELQRRLASGELSAEEEAKVRARLAAIAQERTMLQYQQSQNVFAAQHAEISAKLSALDDEEAELRRKLASGELSSEEAAAIRQRLAAIEEQRSELRRAQLSLYGEEEEATLQLAASGVLSEDELKRMQNRVDELLSIQHGATDKQAAFSANEHQLMQQPSEGRQSADQVLRQEHAGQQTSAEERQQLLEKLGAVNAQLSALDDEEAELRRKLAAGDLGPEEEAAIRRRLDEIQHVKAELMAERAKIEVLQDAMDASELAAAEEKRQHTLARERKRERARRTRNERRRQNLFATISLDPKQGFHEERPAPTTMRFHGVGQPNLQSVRQASERLEPLRQSLGATLQPAALVESLSAQSPRARAEWNRTVGSFGSTLGGATSSWAAAMAVETAGMGRMAAPLGEEGATVAPVLVRSRTLEAKDRLKRSPPATTRALVEALDEVFAPHNMNRWSYCAILRTSENFSQTDPQKFIYQ